MKKKEFRLFGFNVLIWTWKDETRVGAKGRRGFGLVVETDLMKKQPKVKS